MSTLTVTPAVHVCTLKDIVCGDRPDGWCEECPLRAAASQSVLPALTNNPREPAETSVMRAREPSENLGSEAQLTSVRPTLTRAKGMELLRSYHMAMSCLYIAREHSPECSDLAMRGLIKQIEIATEACLSAMGVKQQ